MDNLLLLHGALGNKNQFKELKGLLSVHFEVFTIDFSGHGGRISEEGFSMDLFTEDVLDFIEENSLDKTHIFGYSMGGYVALKFALKFPEKIEKIMCLGTKIDWGPESATRETRMLDWKKMEEKIPAYAEKLKRENHPNDWRKVVEKTARMIHGLGNGSAMKMEDFRKIKKPVLMAIGSEDSMVSKEETQHLADILPSGEFLEIQGFKHPIDIVDKQKLSGIIFDYFSRTT